MTMNKGFFRVTSMYQMKKWLRLAVVGVSFCKIGEDMSAEF